VAHVGDPTFDLAYLLCHLVLKAVHRPGCAASYRDTARRFLGAYGAPASGELSANVACLLLARVDGKSPADYLDPDEQKEVRELGRAMLVDPETLDPFV
jgi:5-methylthioribose kinase